MKKRKLQDALAAKPTKHSSNLAASEHFVEPEYSPNGKSPDANTPNQTAKALVLDDFLAEVDRSRRWFKITPAEMRLASLGLSQKTSRAVTRLIEDTIALYQGHVVTMVNPLLEPIGDDIYGEEIRTVFAPRHQVSLGRQRDVLGRLLELMLQTIVSLPSKDPRPPNRKALDRKAQKSLASALSKLSERVREALHDDDIRARLEVLPKKPELLKLPEAMQDAAKLLDSAANLKVIKVRRGSPNPQIRFTLYLANWVKKCTGRPHYTLLGDLIEAAFQASGKKPPKWIDRLEIEMNREIKCRAKWAQMLLSRPNPLSASQPRMPPSNLTN